MKRSRSTHVNVAALAACAAVTIATLHAPAAHAKPAIQTGTTISLADGVVQGFVDAGARVFLGIPYAAPPAGALRWRPPAPPIPWGGVLDATSFPTACPQLPDLVGTPGENEDCLYLNVWTPDPAPTRLKPVMVWIHGGSNLSGSTGDTVPFPGFDGFLYDGRPLAAEHDVVLVTLNYRLGVFGFFGHAGLAGEDASFPHAGNQGLLDQRAALEWVQDNIEAFGGNPRRVMLFGESAGAFDTCAQVVSPMSRGLFRSAIGQSGSCLVGVNTAADAASAADNIAAAVGCDGAPDPLVCLRATPVADLLAAWAAADPADGGAALGISVDGGFLPDDPGTLVDSGQFPRRVRYLLGANSDEGTIFFITSPPLQTEAEYLAALADSFGDLADDVAALYPVDDFSSPQAAFVRAFGDSRLLCSTYDLVRRFDAAGGRAYAYNFNRDLPVDFAQLLGLGAFHGAEIAYVFGGLQDPAPDDELLGRKIRDYWTSFAKRRRPLAPVTRAVNWRPYHPRRNNVLRLDTTIYELRGFRRTECEFWSSVYDQF